MGTYNLYSSFVQLVGWRLPRAVVEIRVPRRPGAVEGERQLLVVLVFLTPHPEGGEHILTQETQGESVQKKRRGDHIHGKEYRSMEHGEYWQRGGQVRGGARKRAGLAGACAQKRASLRRWAAERGGRVRGMEHLYYANVVEAFVNRNLGCFAAKSIANLGICGIASSRALKSQ